MRERPHFVDFAQEVAEKQKEDGRHAPLILTGPSGVGKNTLIQEVGEFLYKHNIPLDITHGERFITRGLRPGEEKRDRLTAISEDEFKERIAAGDFIHHYENDKGTRYGFRRQQLQEDLKKINPALYVVRGDQILPFFSELHHQREDLGALSPLVISVKASVATIIDRLNNRSATEKEKRERRYQLETQYSLEVGAILNSTMFFKQALEEVWNNSPEDMEFAVESVVQSVAYHIQHWLAHNEPPRIERERP